MPAPVVACSWQAAPQLPWNEGQQPWPPAHTPSRFSGPAAREAAAALSDTHPATNKSTHGHAPWGRFECVCVCVVGEVVCVWGVKHQHTHSHNTTHHALEDDGVGWILLQLLLVQLLSLPRGAHHLKVHALYRSSTSGTSMQRHRWRGDEQKVEERVEGQVEGREGGMWRNSATACRGGDRLKQLDCKPGKQTPWSDVKANAPKPPPVQRLTASRLARAPSGNRLCTFCTRRSASCLHPASIAATATCSCTSHTAGRHGRREGHGTPGCYWHAPAACLSPAVRLPLKGKQASGH